MSIEGLEIVSVRSEEVRCLLEEIDNGDGIIQEYEVNNTSFDGYVDLTVIPGHWTFDQFRRVQNELHQTGLIQHVYTLPQLIASPKTYLRPEMIVSVESEGDDFCGVLYHIRNWHLFEGEGSEACNPSVTQGRREVFRVYSTGLESKLC